MELKSENSSYANKREYLTFFEETDGASYM